MPKVPCPSCGKWIKVRSRTSRYLTTTQSRCKECYKAGKGLTMCKGVSNRGKPCGKFAHMNTGYCIYHLPEEE